MTLRFRDRVSDLTTTTGTGTLTLAGTPPVGFRAFTAFPTGSTVRYTIVHENLTEWEVGEGVWTTSGATLARTKVYSSSNAGVAVNFTAGIKNVIAAPIAQDMARPAFKAFRSATQAVTTSTWVKVNLNAEVYDTAGYFDSTTNFRFTPLEPGYYQFNAQVNVGTATSRCIAALYKNGAAVAVGGDAGSTFRSVVSDVIYCNGATDYVELWVFSTVSPVGSTTQADTFMSGVMLAPAA